MPRFVLLRHETAPSSDREDHWDFMLESPDGLLTWNLQALPTPWAERLGEAGGAGAEVDAEAIVLHRPIYLDYEGPIRGGRGTVRRVAAGTFVATHFAADRYRCTLSGEPLAGEVCLEQRDGTTWRLSITDAPATPPR